MAEERGVSYNDLPFDSVVECLGCGAKNSRTDTLCRSCDGSLDEARRNLYDKLHPRAPAVKKCPNCGAQNPVHLGFCLACWKDFDSSKPVPTTVKHAIRSMEDFDSIRKALIRKEPINLSMVYPKVETLLLSTIHKDLADIKKGQTLSSVLGLVAIISALGVALLVAGLQTSEGGLVEVGWIGLAMILVAMVIAVVGWIWYYIRSRRLRTVSEDSETEKEDG